MTLEHQEAVETLLSATDLRRRGLTAIHHCRPGVWVLRLSMAATTPSLSSDPNFVIHKRRVDDRKECVFLSLFHTDTNTKNSSARTHAHMYKYARWAGREETSLLQSVYAMYWLIIRIGISSESENVALTVACSCRSSKLDSEHRSKTKWLSGLNI